MSKHKRTHGLPMVLSFFIPGLGQIVKGHVLKGVFIFFGMILSLFLMLYVIGIITTPILWLWNLYDAYNAH